MPRSVAVAALTISGLVAAGCSSSGDAGPSAATSAPPTGDRPTTTTTSPAASGECGLQGGYPQPWPDRPAYEVVLDVDPEAAEVTGDLTVRFAPPEPTDRLVFRLWGNAVRIAGAGGRVEVTEASIDGETAETSTESAGGGAGTPGTVFVVHGDFRPGRPAVARLGFSVDLPGAVNDRIAKVGDSIRLGSVLPTLAWLRGRGWHTSPAVGSFSEAAATEVADYDVRVSVPDGFSVLASGTEVEPGRFVAKAVRDWAATVGRLRVRTAPAGDASTVITVGVSEDVRYDLDASLGKVVDAFDDFSRRYGPYPYPDLSVGITPALSGGIEFPGHFQLGTGASTRSLVHEVAHMWFYGLVGNDQYRDPWLDEGLATYAESRHLGTLEARRSAPVPEAGRARLGAGHDYWAGASGSFFRSVYVQGAQALADFGDAAGGQDEVDCGLRRFTLERAYAVATPDDLVEALEAQTGVDPRPVFERYGAIGS